MLLLAVLDSISYLFINREVYPAKPKEEPPYKDNLGCFNMIISVVECWLFPKIPQISNSIASLPQWFAILQRISCHPWKSKGLLEYVY